MSEEPQKRSTYIGQKDWTPRGEVSHLRFVISDFVYDEIMDEECALVVNMTSKYGTSQEDLTCELDVGDHSDITHKSYIVYSMAQRVPKREILENVANKKYILRGKIEQSVLERIQNGVFKRLEDMPRFTSDYIEYF